MLENFFFSSLFLSYSVTALLDHTFSSLSCTAKAFSKERTNRKKSMKSKTRRRKKEISSDLSPFKGRKKINCNNNNTHTSDNKLKGKKQAKIATL